MAADPTLAIRFKDMESDEELRGGLEQRLRHLAEEFPETTRYELTLSQDAGEVSAHTHATGKDTNAASHASGSDARQAAERAVDKLERELRRLHDKRIFAHRREAQRATGKRTGS